MNDSRQTEYDVAIAGAGPAGSSLAIRLACRDLRVLLVEQKKFPREKLCGEFISPECLAHLDELGIAPVIAAACGTEINQTVFYARGGRSVTVPSAWFNGNGQPALGLSRAELDLTLMNRAKEAGVDVREETTVSGLLNEHESVHGVVLKRKDGSNERCRSALSVDATGRTRALARFVKNHKRPQATHVAFKTHLKNTEIESGTCEIYSYRGGYGGCNMVEDGLANVCFIIQTEDARRFGRDPERAFRERLMSNSRAMKTLGKSSAVKPWLAVPIDRYGRGQLTPAFGLFSVGDAAAFIDPFTGSGILLALESSKVATDAIESYFAESRNFLKLQTDYSQTYSCTIDSRLRFSSVMRAFAYSPILAGMLVTALRVSPILSRSFARATRS